MSYHDEIGGADIREVNREARERGLAVEVENLLQLFEEHYQTYRFNNKHTDLPSLTSTEALWKAKQEFRLRHRTDGNSNGNMKTADVHLDFGWPTPAFLIDYYPC